MDNFYFAGKVPEIYFGNMGGGLFFGVESKILYKDQTKSEPIPGHFSARFSGHF